MKNSVKKIIIGCWLTALLFIIVFIFWRQEYVYSTPTPIPTDYSPVMVGQQINFNENYFISSGKPTFIHFFNPDCPCSRFNMPYFKTLVLKYGDKVNFALVVFNKLRSFTDEEVLGKYNLNIPVIHDSLIAKKCGVYSTPQAVIIDSKGHLIYRGNYNQSRYCANKKTNYAEATLDSLLERKKIPDFGLSASKSYGCTLPNCKK